jgi:hypothetical protein
MRVTKALLETERQKVKLLITTANAVVLREHAAASIEDFETIKAESQAVVAASRRERRDTLS